MGLSTQYDPSLLELLLLVAHFKLHLLCVSGLRLPSSCLFWRSAQWECGSETGGAGFVLALDEAVSQSRFPSWFVVPTVPNFDSTHLCPLSPDPISPSTSLLSWGGLPKFAIAALVMLLLFSRLVVSDSLRPHGLQRARLPRPSLSPGACSNSCPLSFWCLPTLSSSAVPFSSCPQFSAASGSFKVSQLFTSGGQSIGASATASVLPISQGGFALGWSGLISLLCKTGVAAYLDEKWNAGRH